MERYDLPVPTPELRGQLHELEFTDDEIDELRATAAELGRDASKVHRGFVALQQALVTGSVDRRRHDLLNLQVDKQLPWIEMNIACLLCWRRGAQSRTGSLRMVTAEEVEEAVMAASIGHIPHHKCGECSYPCSYFVDGHQLWFDGCEHCTSSIGWQKQARTWKDLAGWINIQVDPGAEAEVRRRCGLVSMRWLAMPTYGEWTVVQEDGAAAVVICPETGLVHWCASASPRSVTGVSTARDVAMHRAETALLGLDCRSEVRSNLRARSS